MKCPFCGSEQEDTARFCTDCGKYMGSAEPEAVAAPATIPAASENQTNQEKFREFANQVQAKAEEPQPSDDSPWATIGIWGWIGILLLMQIPIVNFVLVIVWSFGGTTKRVKQNYARATLIIGLVSVIITVASVVLMFATGKRLGLFEMMRQFFTFLQ